SISGAEHEIDIRTACEEAVPFLLGQTTADSKNQIGLPLLERFELTQTGEYFLSRFFTNAAGVDQNQVGVKFICRCGVTQTREKSRHFFRVVDVHLAPVRFDVVLLRHVGPYFNWLWVVPPLGVLPGPRYGIYAVQTGIRPSPTRHRGPPGSAIRFADESALL